MTKVSLPVLSQSAPPPASAILLLSVLFVSVTLLSLKMAPPKLLALFPLKVLLLIFRVPWLRIAPPIPPVLLLMVLLLIVNDPVDALKMAPPLLPLLTLRLQLSIVSVPLLCTAPPSTDELPPLVRVRLFRATTAPALTVKTL